MTSYADYVKKEKEKQKDVNRFGNNLAPITAHAKKVGAGDTYKYAENLKAVEQHLIRKASMVGSQRLYICYKCTKSVSIYARRKQQGQRVLGKGYKSLLCYGCLRFEGKL